MEPVSHNWKNTALCYNREDTLEPSMTQTYSARVWQEDKWFIA